jgi:hypothetical protein
MSSDMDRAIKAKEDEYEQLKSALANLQDAHQRLDAEGCDPKDLENLKDNYLQKRNEYCSALETKANLYEKLSNNAGQLCETNENFVTKELQYVSAQIDQAIAEKRVEHNNDLIKELEEKLERAKELEKQY